MPSDIKKRYDELNREYAEKFGEPFALGFGGPETMDDAIPVMESCLDSGEEFDPYSFNDAPLDSVF